MTAEALLFHLAAGGVTVRIEDGQLRARGPADVLTDELLTQMREQRAAIIAAIETSKRPRTIPCIACGRFHFVEPCLCYWCRSARESSNSTAESTHDSTPLRARARKDAP